MSTKDERRAIEERKRIRSAECSPGPALRKLMGACRPDARPALMVMLEHATVLDLREVCIGYMVDTAEQMPSIVTPPTARAPWPITLACGAMPTAARTELGWEPNAFPGLWMAQTIAFSEEHFKAADPIHIYIKGVQMGVCGHGVLTGRLPASPPSAVLGWAATVYATPAWGSALECLGVVGSYQDEEGRQIDINGRFSVVVMCAPSDAAWWWVVRAVRTMTGRDGTSIVDPQARSSAIIKVYATMLAAVGNVLTAGFGLAHCKNVALQDRKPARVFYRFDGVKHERDLVVKTLVIRPSVPRRESKVREAEAQRDTLGEPRRWHLVRGHWADYRSGRGLFGRRNGLFWVPMHARGSATTGVVEKTYSVQGAQRAQP